MGAGGRGRIRSDSSGSLCGESPVWGAELHRSIPSLGRQVSEPSQEPKLGCTVMLPSRPCTLLIAQYLLERWNVQQHPPYQRSSQPLGHEGLSACSAKCPSSGLHGMGRAPRCIEQPSSSSSSSCWSSLSSSSLSLSCCLVVV